MDADAKALIDRLNKLRLDENRSYASLANEIGIDPGAFYKLLNDRTAAPYDRTLHKIRRFLDGLPSSRKARKQQKGAAA